MLFRLFRFLPRVPCTVSSFLCPSPCLTTEDIQILESEGDGPRPHRIPPRRLSRSSLLPFPLSSLSLSLSPCLLKSKAARGRERSTRTHTHKRERERERETAREWARELPSPSPNAELAPRLRRGQDRILLAANGATDLQKDHPLLRPEQEGGALASSRACAPSLWRRKCGNIRESGRLSDRICLPRVRSVFGLSLLLHSSLRLVYFSLQAIRTHTYTHTQTHKGESERERERERESSRPRLPSFLPPNPDSAS